jgi:hypothetical protein
MVNDPETIAVATAGEARYRALRAEIEVAHKGKYLIINVDTGEYEIDSNYVRASDRARARWPGGRRYAARIGYDEICRVGSTAGAKR